MQKVSASNNKVKISASIISKMEIEDVRHKILKIFLSFLKENDNFVYLF
jgi:hypothetical protein